MWENIRKTIIVSLLISIIFCMIGLPFLWNNVIREHIVSYLFYFIPIIIIIAVSIYSGFRLIEKEEPEKILYKIPIFATLTSIILAFIFSVFIFIAVVRSGEAEAGMAIILIPYAFLASIIIGPIIGFVIALPLRFFGEFKKIIIFLGVLLSILLVINMFVILTGSSCGRQDFRCWANKAIESNDSSICKNADTEDICYVWFAKSTGNISVCQIDWEEKVTKKDSCYLSVAKTTKNESICETLVIEENLKDNCFSDIALQNKDITLCEKVKDEFFKEECIKNLSK